VPRLADIVDLLELAYDPATAQEWDAVGLVCGDPDADVTRVHFAVDPVTAVVEEAVASGAELLVTHHPLYLSGTTSVAATTAKGRAVHRLISAGVGLYVAHTNADVATPGVSDALAAAVGLRQVRPLDVVPGGLGRIGELPAAMMLEEFVAAVAGALPVTEWGVRGAGDPRQSVRTVAVCGGSGGDLAEAAARAGADVLLTSDLKHHRTSESVEDGVIALIDAAHWATEWPWLAQAAAVLNGGGGRASTATVETTVSTIVTDPWTTHAHRAGTSQKRNS
jgi:dinuclear metal center YbgI/SA1388 family protein